MKLRTATEDWREQIVDLVQDDIADDELNYLADEFRDAVILRWQAEGFQDFTTANSQRFGTHVIVQDATQDEMAAFVVALESERAEFQKHHLCWDTAHTPGPWKINEWHYREIPGKENVTIIHSDRDAIAEVCDLYYPHGPDGRKEANARLIAAAPELLAALVALLDHANEYSDAMTEFGRGSSQLGANADCMTVAGQARLAISNAITGGQIGYQTMEGTAQ